MIKKKGFTLIELLVVIAIISLLSSIVMASLSSAKAKAEDARRVAEVKQIATALFMLADKNNGVYPSSGGTTLCLGTGGTCWNGLFSGSAILNNALTEFMKTIPADPAIGKRAGKGDRYLYSDATSDVAVFCGITRSPGPFIYYIPEITEPAVAADCKIGFSACCGNQFGCSAGRACVYPLR